MLLFYQVSGAVRIFNGRVQNLFLRVIVWLSDFHRDQLIESYYLNLEWLGIGPHSEELDLCYIWDVMLALDQSMVKKGPSEVYFWTQSDALPRRHPQITSSNQLGFYGLQNPDSLLRYRLLTLRTVMIVQYGINVLVGKLSKNKKCTFCKNHTGGTIFLYTLQFWCHILRLSFV